MKFPIDEAKHLISLALDEDLGTGDVSCQWTIPTDQLSQAQLIAKATGVLAGLDFVPLVCERVDPQIKVQLHFQEGDQVKPGDVIGVLEGPSVSILGAERTFLNFLQHLSGVATHTAQVVAVVDPSSKTQILDTRKTLPGYRLLQKYAVLQGGGVNHRIGLYDMVMLKENHIKAAGGITEALELVFANKSPDMKVEVEVESLEQIPEALSYPIHQIMLDNMDSATMTQGVQQVRQIRPQVKVEASGNMTLERIPEVSLTGVDYISLGALTHSVQAFDISLRFK